VVHIETVCEITSEPAIVHCSTILPIGSDGLLCIWYQGAYETSSDTVLKYSLRRQDGTWGDAEVLFDFCGAPLGNPVLWRPSPDGSIYLTFSVLTSEDWKSSLLFYSRSDDNGRTWTPPALFLSRPGFMGKTKPVVLTDGTVLYPLYHEGEYCPYVMRITDLSFPMGSSLVAETMARKKAIQPALFSIDGRRILMMCRTNQGTVWRSVSFNSGYSWSILRPTALPNPDSAVDLFVGTDDHIGIVFNPSADERNVLALAESRDDGQSWERREDLVSGVGEYSYPFAVNLPDGEVAVSYTDSRYAIRMAVFNPSSV
jgi:predicted neuraminidase